MDRREFLVTGAAALGSLALPGSVHRLRAEEAPPKSRVWQAQGDPVPAARRLAEAAGLASLIPAGGVVVIKPNIAFPAPPAWGATSDPEFLGAVIDLCLEGGARRVIVVDHPVGASPQANLERTGLGAVCAARPAAQVMMLSEEMLFRDHEVPAGRVLKQTKTARLLDRADLFINLPTAKHHSQTAVSLGFKNLMGLIWDRAPLHQELDLDQAIADLGTILKPGITFLEARRALVTGGPTGPGQVEEVNRYMAGFDPVAVDACGVELARWNGRVMTGTDVPHLLRAADLGLGVIDKEQIEMVDV
ncbi:MAG: DUF362 domain-containing protein [Candidatus Zixiibacteriota bacterium]|nr:MAG: DUF362 domain-containing protein [candidate division Zixibacteria bacterium]